MGFRFKKSKQIAPGMRVNFNKKSTSVTFGSKGVHHTVSSSGKKTTSVGVPGSGLYYTSSSGGGGGSRSNDDSSVNFASGGENGDSVSPASGNNGSKKGCGAYLLYAAIALLIVVICKYLSIVASIIAVPVFIYFWMHKEKEPRKLYLGFTIFAFIFGWAFSLPSDIDKISVKSSDTIVMDINSDKNISFSIDPEDGNTDELKLVSSNPDILSAHLDKSDGKITISSRDKTGNTTIYLKDTNADVSSKSIKVTVEDKKAIAEAKKKAEEEKKRKAEEAKKKEQARIAAEKKKAEESQQTTDQTTTTEKEEMVWVSNTGSKYHSNPNCSNMRNPIKETLSDAKSRGLSPCSKCY